MGFRKDTYATVWQIWPISNTMTKARISIDRKNKETGQYEQDFSGFVVFVGTANAARAARLREKDRIRIGNVDVTNRYDKEKRVEYTDFKVFDFQDANQPRAVPEQTAQTQVDYTAADGDTDDLPF